MAKKSNKTGLIVTKKDMLYNVIYQGNPNKAILESKLKTILSSGIETNAEVVMVDKTSYEECKENIEQLTELIEQAKDKK